MRTKLLALLAVMALVLGACGGSSGGDSNDASGGHDAHSGGATDSGSSTEGEVPGSLADASEADTEILIKASDDLTFDPETINVKPGEVVTFVVRNEGNNVHEFVLGDPAYQEMHEQEAEEMEGHDMSAMENAVTVEPGETKEITWKFTEATSLQFACHEPGHYEGGMLGTIDVG